MLSSAVQACIGSITGMESIGGYLGLFSCFCLLRGRESIAQRLCGLELHLIAGSNLNLLTGARIASLTGFGSFAFENAQPAYLGLACDGDRAGDLIDQAVIGRFGRCF